MDLLNDLNEAQRKAVEYIDGPSLVIAGAVRVRRVCLPIRSLIFCNRA